VEVRGHKGGEGLEALRRRDLEDGLAIRPTGQIQDGLPVRPTWAKAVLRHLRRRAGDRFLKPDLTATGIQRPQLRQHGFAGLLDLLLLSR
jgi:hypothetical protein